MIRENYDQDSYGTVLNTPKTYDAIAADLQKHGSVIIGWTEGAMTHLDILFTVAPIQVGSLQRGMSTHTDLFVSVSHFGMHGFEINDDDLHPGYVNEKINLGGGDNVTSVAFTELINQVKKRLV
jgi:hypothetical protein